MSAQIPADVLADILAKNALVRLHGFDRSRYVTVSDLIDEIERLREVVEAADVMRCAIFGGPIKCPHCQWPLVERVEDGCIPGNCSMRPVPNRAPVNDACAAYDRARVEIAATTPPAQPGRA